MSKLNALAAMVDDLETMPQQEADEYTASQLARQAKCYSATARKQAEALVKAGRWTKRQVIGTESKQTVWAYRKAKVSESLTERIEKNLER